METKQTIKQQIEILNKEYDEGLYSNECYISEMRRLNKLNCKALQKEQTAQDLINSTEYTQEDQTDLNITKCLREMGLK